MPARPFGPASSPWHSVTRGIEPPYHAHLAPPYRPGQATYEPQHGHNLDLLCIPINMGKKIVDALKTFNQFITLNKALLLYK